MITASFLKGKYRLHILILCLRGKYSDENQKCNALDHCIWAFIRQTSVEEGERFSVHPKG